MASQPNTFYPAEEYLELERKAEYKSEYYNGEIYAMSGASRNHNAIAFSLTGMVRQHLRGKACRGFTSDMRVLVRPSGLYTYPDLSATCEPPQYLDGQLDTLLNPSLIVEILSPSTLRYDRGEKANLYRDLPSLHELLLITQDQYEVELYRRESDSEWKLIHVTSPDAIVELRSIGYTLSLRELYENVDFASAEGA